MSKKKKVVDARFRDRNAQEAQGAQGAGAAKGSAGAAPKSTAKPTPPTGKNTRPLHAASTPGKPRFDRVRSASRGGEAPVELTPPEAESGPALPSWLSANLVFPLLLAVGFVAVGVWVYRDRQEQAELHRDAGVYAPEVTDAAVPGDAAAPTAPSAPTAPADAGATDAGAADAGTALALNGDPVEARVAEPSSPDPRQGRFTLDEATRGLAGSGDLVADIDTSMGTFQCTLLSGEAPNTVANFVGLARGLRDFWDPSAGRWVRRPFYDGSIFHRVIPGFMIQGGDVLRSGYGGTGYEFGDENVTGHNAAGQLCMANHGPNTNGGQFFITEAPRTHLDGTYSIFGRCTPTELVGRVARVETNGERPRVPVFIRSVRVRRSA
ncbi:MAG: peptidylprolyl isomerase [Myxococcales bacterium]|nr:peptidylprolyl isomerase [Myxococcales bacterium]